jgi:hypothetical protein
LAKKALVKKTTSKPVSKSIKVTPIRPTWPIKTNASILSKQDFLNLLELVDFRKIIRDILQDVLTQKEKIVEMPEDMECNNDDYDDNFDPMIIDVARLDNSKDLLAVEGKVNGSNIQCLADSCANLSFVQDDASNELGLVIDDSVKHNIAGASGTNRSLGIARDVLIELKEGCVIKEDLVVLADYPFREIGLSRACLKRYNYDVYESRGHLALTFDGKEFFIPIIPDQHRNKN